MFYLFIWLHWVLVPRPGMEPRPPASRAQSLLATGPDRKVPVCCFVLFFLNNNSFIEILFMYLTVYPLPVYKSVVFSIFTELYNHYHSQSGRFSSPSKKKCRSHPQSLSPSSSPSVHVSFCPESGSAFREAPSSPDTT